MKSLKFKMLAMMLVGVLSIWSCNKDDEDNDTTTAQENALAESTFNDVHSMVDQANYYNSSKGMDSLWSSYFSACTNISHDTVSIPHKIIIDFGSTNCLCYDGKYRRGLITASYTGRYRDSATVIGITFTDYYVNDNKVQGTKTITNNGRNADGNLNFDIEIVGQIDKVNNGGTISWTSSRNREWIEGDATISVWDDVYLITGEADGTGTSGTSFEIDITNPLRKEIGCVNFVSGTFTLKITQKALRTIDYGSGSCDNTATVTILNQTYTITLN